MFRLEWKSNWILLILISFWFNGFPFSLNVDALSLEAINQISEQCIKDIDTWKTSFDLLTKELEKCSKTRDPEKCEVFKKAIFHDNLYALYQFDSFGKIPPNLLGLNKIWMGDYDECLDVKHPSDNNYQTQFCWAHLNLPMGKLLAGHGAGGKTLKSSCGAGKSTDVKLSICMPRSCSETDLKLALNHLSIVPIPGKNTSIFGELLQTKNQTELVCQVTCRPTEFHPDNLFWIFTVILAATVALCVLATIADYYQEQSIDEFSLEKKEKQEIKGLFMFLMAFSLLTNGRSLLRISKNPNNLKGVECIRFLSFTWVVSGHIWGGWQESDNGAKVLDILKERDYEVWVNAFFSVDTFFFLSGLMLSYSFLPKLTIRKAMSPMVWFVFYLHRILRLTPAYFTFMFFYTTYGPLTDFGPNEVVKIDDMENCRYYGWKNLLYINNLYEPRKSCLSISWYMAADTQMYLISPFFLVAFLLGPIPGLVVSFSVILVSTILNYWLFLRYDLPLTLIQAYMTGDIHIIHLVQDLVYEAAYIRIPPFIFGIGMGYLMWKSQSFRIKINIGLVFVLWILSTILALGSLLSIYKYNRGDYWTPFERASYYGFSRIAWSIALSWLIFAVNRGYSGLIGKFMSLNFWTPLGKLTFCCYLSHIMILHGISNLERTPLHFVGALHTYITKIIPSVLCTCIFALVWTLLFEMPFAKLEGILIRKLTGRRRSEKSECTKF